MNKEQVKTDALKFLKENVTAVIATSFDHEPRASTVYYHVDDNFNFYFVTKRTTSKYLFTRMNAHVAVVVGFGPEHITVQARGIVELVVDENERKNLLHTFAELGARENINMWPIEEMEHLKGANLIVMKIVPNQVLFMNLDSKKFPDSHNDDYMEVVSVK